MIVLRDYQREAIAAARDGWDAGDRGQMIVLATGTGKTATGLSLAVEELDEGHRVLWLAHRDELVRQPMAAICRHWPDYADSTGIVKAERNDVEARLVLASVATLDVDGRLDAVLRYGAFDLIIVDEAHHSVSAMWQRVLSAAGGDRWLGLTATPDREDSADLSARWSIAYHYPIAAALRDGHLVHPYAVVVPLPELDLSRVGGRKDYDDGELGAELLRAHVVEHVVEALGETHLATRLPERDATSFLTAKGRGILVYTATIEQARLTAEALCVAGWTARHVSGETPQTQRRELLQAFESGAIDALCNAAVLTEGTDLPRAGCLVLARPTRSHPLYIQMVGRGLRPHPSVSDCLLIDIGGATEAHDLRFAPVLIGGSRCNVSPSGEHTFIEQADGKGVCGYCNKVIPCFKGLGPHKYVDGLCTACGRVQCPESATMMHEWVAIEDYQRECLACGVRMRDPLASLAQVRHRDTTAVKIVRIPGVVPETYACDVDQHGILYWVGDRADDGSWSVYWLKRRGTRPWRLVREPVPSSEARLYAEDIVRRAERAREDAPWRAQRATTRERAEYAALYGRWPTRGASAGEVDAGIVRARARERALAVGLVREEG